MFVKTEKGSSSTSQIGIETLVGNQLYFKNTLNENITISQIKIGNRECNITQNISTGVHPISLGDCVNNLTLDSSIGDIVVITDKQIFAKKHLFKDVQIINQPISNNLVSIVDDFSEGILNEVKFNNSDLILNNSSGSYSLIGNYTSKIYDAGALANWSNLNWDYELDTYNIFYNVSPNSWENSGNTLPSILASSQLAVIDDYIYLFGGRLSGDTYTNVIYRAPISNPTNWVNTGSTLPSNLGFSQLAIIDDYIYLFGGYSGVARNVIYRAPISNPLNWINTGSTLPSTLSHSQLAIIDDYIYLFGGANPGSNAIFRAPKSNPLNWVNTGSTLPDNILYGAKLLIIDDYIYLFGGQNGSSNENTIYKAPVSNPLNWSNTDVNLPDRFYYPIMGIVGDYIYSFGNYRSNTIYKAPVSNPLNWVEIGIMPITNLLVSQLLILDNTVYIYGGYNKDIIYKAEISNSTIGVKSFVELNYNPSWSYKLNSYLIKSNLTIETRTSNNNIDWTNWQTQTLLLGTINESARYFQYRILFETENQDITPILKQVSFDYKLN